jgi:hypothetical protein
VKDLEQHFFELKKSWPSSLVARDQVGKFSGGVISSKYIANLDCRGLGPAERLRMAWGLQKGCESGERLFIL